MKTYIFKLPQALTALLLVAFSHISLASSLLNDPSLAPPAKVNKVLYIGDNYLPQAKMDLLNKAALAKGFQLDSYKAKTFTNKLNKAEISPCDYPLVLLQAVSDEIAGTVFPDILNAIDNCSSRIGSPVSLVTIGFNHTRNKESDFNNKVHGYLENSLESNYQNLFSYLANEILGKNYSVKPVKVLPKVGAYHPEYDGLMTDDMDGFLTWLKNKDQSNQPFNENSTQSPKAKVGVLIHRTAIENGLTQLVDSTIKSIERQGGLGFAVYFDGKNAHDDFVKLLSENSENHSKQKVNALINYRMLHEAEKNKQDFTAIGVPVIQGLIYRDGDRKSFDDAQAGLSAMMSPYFLMMPESAGVIDPTMVATMDKDRNVIPMLDHVNAVAERAIKQGLLSIKDNAQKKLALFMWNYPPGDKNMGAAFLNVPDSIRDIAKALKKAGYSIDLKNSDTLIEEVGQILRPFYTQSGLDLLMEKGLSDYLPVEEYEAWLNTLPKSVSAPIIKRWGQPTDNIYVRNVNGQAAFIIPQIKMGNLVAMMQPTRNEDKDKHASLYHDMASPINHYYLAVYLYAKKKHNSDAFIHLGTHGTQEWLTGKERGLSIYDAPQLTVGNTPIVYPFVMDNVGEAMQAKRRGRAVMLSHMTPGFAEAGYYGDSAELEELLEQYMTLSDGKTKTVVQGNIVKLSKKLNIFEDIGFTEEQIKADFDEFMHATHDYMHELSAESQPLGVHTYGQTLNDPHLMTTVSQMLGSEFKTLVKEFESTHTITLKQGPDVFSQKMKDNNVVQLDDTPGFKLLWAHIVEKQKLDVSDKLAEQLVKAQQHASNIRGQQEMENMLKGLNGEFVPVGYGGDPVRAHDAVPTGVNLLGFNPAKVPSKAAWEVGKKLVDDLIAKHYQEKGQYPDKLAFSLWSLETMRHHGVLESQVLYAMGVKPKWDDNGFLRGTEIIPYSELKRPRVDVVASATGLYRDAFPNVMLMIAKAIKQVAELKEDNNSIYKNTQALKQQLLEEGVDEKEAQYLSTVRLFSNESGSYGSGLAATALASDTWEEDSKMANLYLKRMGYAFGHDAKRWSDKVDGLYDKALSGTDAVLFSRSSNLYGMNTSDDPFQYFGGMALAVRNIDGKSPDMMISNLRETNNAKSESFNRFMARELRNRSFHPRWIEEAQKEGYAGASMMLDRLNNFWGWTVMYPEGVTNAQWQEFAEVYVKDKYDMEMREFFENSNPTNLAQMIERMLEAERKEYWSTDQETLKQLVQTYLEIKQEHNVFSENEKFLDNLAQQAQGFGLAPLLESANAAMAQELAEQAAASQANEMVEGQKLEQQQPQEVTEQEVDWLTALFASSLLLAFIIGALQQGMLAYRQKPLVS